VQSALQVALGALFWAAAGGGKYRARPARRCAHPGYSFPALIHESAWRLRVFGVLRERASRLAGDFSRFSLDLAVLRSHAFAAVLHLDQRVFLRSARA
jgi:hypothetical protein